MATLAQLKRDASRGRMSVMLLWRFGKSGNDIPREMRGVRKVFRFNSVGLVLELNGKESTLYTNSAKLVEYDTVKRRNFVVLELPPVSQNVVRCKIRLETVEMASCFVRSKVYPAVLTMNL